MVSARTITSKLAGLIFPISAFITLGFEHSIANFYLLPTGLLAGATGSLRAALANLVAVTLDPTAVPAQVVFAASTADIHTVLIEGRRIV